MTAAQITPDKKPYIAKVSSDELKRYHFYMKTVRNTTMVDWVDAHTQKEAIELVNIEYPKAKSIDFYKTTDCLW